jgi:cytochrome c5
VGSLCTINAIAGCVFAFLAAVYAPVHAADDVKPNKIEPLLDGYYPTYPPTAPAVGEQQKLIERGEYLSKMGDCIACHTNVKGNTPSYAGGLPIESPFGTFYSPNITPDKKTGIGTWTENDFIRAMKEGRDPQGHNYFPAFPYIYFTNMTDDDVRALYAYFMSIPAVELKNRPHSFPLSLPGARFSLWGWNLLFFFPHPELEYDPDESPEWNRGKYIVDGLGHCSMCHTPLNTLGAPKNRFYLTGAFINGYWAPNITKYGLISVGHYDIADVFEHNELLHEAGPVAGPMAEVNHNSLGYLTKDDRLAIATYLKTVVSEDPLEIPSLAHQPTLKRGKQVYVNTCIICHQDGKMSAPVIGNGANWYMRLQQSGLTGLYRHAIYGYNSMPIKGACVNCNEDDLKAAVDYILDKSLSRSEKHDLAAGGALKFPASGKDIYNESCYVCHNEGKLGAPKLGDHEVWTNLLTKNMDVLIENTINSEHHPKQGGCETCTTREIIDAIKYMLSQSHVEGNYSLW